MMQDNTASKTASKGNTCHHMPQTLLSTQKGLRF